MPVDFKRRIIFIHIPRTGGTSIEILLNMVGPENFWSPYPLTHLDPDRTPQHFTYRQLLACLSRDLIDEALVFAFVRNPWERLVSEYEWQRNLYSSCRHNPDRLDLSFLATFESFVRILELTEEERGDTWRNFDGHLETQTSFLLDEFGKIGVSTLGRFERFSEDLGMILSRAGVKVTRVPHSNRSGRRNYESYYTNSTHDAVATFYAADIENFGYTFGK